MRKHHIYPLLILCFFFFLASFISLQSVLCALFVFNIQTLHFSSPALHVPFFYSFTHIHRYLHTDLVLSWYPSISVTYFISAHHLAPLLLCVAEKWYVRMYVSMYACVLFCPPFPFSFLVMRLENGNEHEY